MDTYLRQLLDYIPERTSRSKLQPYVDVIRELRRKRRTYFEISQFLREHLQLSVAQSTIYSFVQGRAREARQQKWLALVKDSTIDVGAQNAVKEELQTDPYQV